MEQQEKLLKFQKAVFAEVDQKTAMIRKEAEQDKAQTLEQKKRCLPKRKMSCIQKRRKSARKTAVKPRSAVWS